MLCHITVWCDCVTCTNDISAKQTIQVNTICAISKISIKKISYCTKIILIFNIVRVLLENYGYTVLDLGRDVPCQLVADTAKEHGVKLVGLSALMTTTLGAMEETIQLVKASCPDCKIVVGGAVLTADYAEKIGAALRR